MEPGVALGCGGATLGMRSWGWGDAPPSLPLGAHWLDPPLPLVLIYMAHIGIHMNELVYGYTLDSSLLYHCLHLVQKV